MSEATAEKNGIREREGTKKKTSTEMKGKKSQQHFIDQEGAIDNHNGEEKKSNTKREYIDIMYYIEAQHLFICSFIYTVLWSKVHLTRAHENKRLFSDFVTWTAFFLYIAVYVFNCRVICCLFE